MAVPKRVHKRIADGTRKYRKILDHAKTRDVNEADTVTIVKAILADVFGWNPFFELTSEYQVRGTYVDLAVKVGDQVLYLIEVKAVGSNLRENHLRQAVGYAARHGMDWVALTNGVTWQAYRVVFGKPVTHELVFEIDFLTADSRDTAFIEQAFLLTKEGMTKSAIVQFHTEKQALSRYNIAAVVLDEAVIRVIRREFRRAHPEVNPTVDELQDLLLNEVLKREVVEGDRAEAARKLIRKSQRALRSKAATAQRETVPLVVEGPLGTPLKKAPGPT